MIEGHRRATWVAVPLWLFSVAVAGWILLDLSVRTDMTALLPRSSDPLQELIVSQLQNGAAARLILIGLEGAPPETLATHSRQMASQLRDSGLFSLVANGDSTELEAAGSWLFRHRYRLSETVTPEQFTASGLHASLEALLAQLRSLSNPLAKQLAGSDPTGTLPHLLGAWTNGVGPARQHGVWFAPDGTRAYLLAESAAPGSDLDRQAEAVAAIRRAATHTEAAPIQLLLTGPAVFGVEARATIEADSWRLSLFAGALVLGLLVLAYRSVIPVALSAIPVLTGLLTGIAAVQLVFGYVHGITLGFGATLIGEAVDYPAYAQLHARAGEALRQTLPRIWPTLRLAVLTTMFGTVSLLWSSFIGLSQLGLLTVVGVGAAGCVTRWVLPALAPTLRVSPGQSQLAITSRAPASRPGSPGWLAAFAFAVALGTIVWNIDRLWDDDLAHLSPIPASVKRLDEAMRQDVGAPDVRYLVVIRGETEEDVLQRSEATLAVLEPLVKQSAVTGYDLPSRYIPSRATQLRRIEALPDSASLHQALTEAQRGLPFKPGAFAPFEQAIANTRAEGPIAPSEITEAAWRLKLRALLFSQGTDWIGLAPLRGVRSADRIQEQVQQADVPGLSFFDLKTETERLVRGYRRESLILAAWGLAGMAAVLWWGLHGIGPAMRVLLPPLLAVTCVVAGYSVIGISLTLFHMVALLLVIGIGLNYALFVYQYHQPTQEPEDRTRTIRSLTVCILATLCAFGVLSLSPTPVLHAIGSTVTLGALLSLLFAMVMGRRLSPTT